MRYILCCVLLTASLSSILIAQATRSTTRAAESIAVVNLRAIGRAIIQYSNENRGYLPADLGQLVAAKCVGAEVFIRPEPMRTLELPMGLDRDELATWVNENTDFIYFRPAQTKFSKHRRPQDTPIVFERHSQGPREHASMAVLYLDGHVTVFVPAPSAPPTTQPTTTTVPAVSSRPRQ